MTIQKKSLISTLNTTKKAIVASTPSAASPVEPTVGLSRVAFSKKGLSRVAFSKKGLSRVAFSKKGLSRVAFSKKGLSKAAK